MIGQAISHDRILEEPVDGGMEAVTRKSSSLLVLLLLTGLGTFADGQDFWQKKSYQEWSDRECQKLLHDSPWAQTFSNLRFVDRRRERKSDELQRGGESQPEFSYVALIRSALPIRQALVRQLKLDPKFVQKTPQEKQTILAESARLLSEKFADRISIYVGYQSNVGIYDADLVRFWQTQNTETLRNQIYLIQGSDRIELIGYQSAKQGQNGFELTFPRHVNGRPLLSAADKTLTLSIELLDPAARQLWGRPIAFRFKPEKMVFQGELSY
jgi:hypothetical protein